MMPPTREERERWEKQDQARKAYLKRIRENNPHMVDAKCSLCESEITDHWLNSGDEGQIMRSHTVCFSCAFWMVIREQYDEKNVTINGTVYYVGSAPKGARFAGMGGRRFDIQRFGEEEAITTYDLWCRGEVPAHMKNLFPDDAEFLSAAQKVVVGDTTCWNPSSP